MTVTAMSGVDRIARAFGRAREERRMAVVIYLTVGFPDRAATPALLRAALDGGADIIELGVPFSDPMADGTTIQRASEVALRHGVRPSDCIAEAATLVAERDATVILMGYLNPFLRFGPERLAAECVRNGIAGVIAYDLPAEEAADLDSALVPADVARIDVVAPTTPETRLARLLPVSRGFVYCVSLTGVTGARAGLSEDVGPFLGRVRAHTGMPVVVGFGISRPEHVALLRGRADGVAVGSAAIDAVASGGADALRELVRSLRAAGAA